MKIQVIGNLNASYVQNLCLIYFPGSKFSVAEADEKITEIPYTKVTISYPENGCKATVQLVCQEGEATEEFFCENTGGHTQLKCEQIAVGAAFLAAGTRIFNYTPPWGFLTGIRPAKIAAKLYEELGTKVAVRKVLTGEYLLSPKKAQLLTNVAVKERKNLSKFGSDTCSLYVSIPFCPTRCAYCSFVSYSTKRLLSMIPEYMDRLLSDIDDIAQVIAERGQKVSTIYIGGGTPTTLDEYQLERLLTKLAERFPVAELEEFTLEAGRPDTLTKEKLEIAQRCGVNRVSVNPQTLNDEVLTLVGRRHTAEDFYRGYAMAREAGIPCINTDLIAGLPGDTFRSFAQTMDKIAELRPENITVHTFCVKKSADILKSGQNIFSRTGGDTVKCVDYSQLVCMKFGYRPYYLYRQKNMAGNLENVGFTLPGFDGYYNSLIMAEEHSIYAVGAGAVTKLVSKSGSIKRYYMPKYPYEYLDTEKGLLLKDEFLKEVRSFDFR